MLLLYINDSPNVSSDDLFILFADDMTSPTAPVILQHVRNCIGDWFSANKLALSVPKTKQMLFFKTICFTCIIFK